MIDLAEFLSRCSIISLILHSLRVHRKEVLMALRSSPPASSSSPSFSWAGLRSPVFARKSVIFAPAIRDVDENQEKSIIKKEERLSHFEVENMVRKDAVVFAASAPGKEKMVSTPGIRSPAKGKAVEVKVASKLRKRPARIVVPDSYQSIGFLEEAADLGEKEFEAEGRHFYMASKRGGRKASEDGYGVITDVSGDPKQAFFGVFDGHGGRAAVDYVMEKLGPNILTAVGKLEKSEDQVQEAIKAGYLTTDKEFLSKGAGSGVCAATVLVKDGELHAANAGDCRVVLSRNGVAEALTRDHRPENEDERHRIETSGGYVNCYNGVWRVQGSLAISRAIGDVHLKDWIISEPEINKLRLTADCEFLIMASDGLWDKVSNQEAVDAVMRHKNSVESCKALVDISSSRGSKDDITVMVVYLRNFTEFGDD
ncbi:hypothetical protein ACLOJK_016931 [Asimina triloba]